MGLHRGLLMISHEVSFVTAPGKVIIPIVNSESMVIASRSPVPPGMIPMVVTNMQM